MKCGKAVNWTDFLTKQSVCLERFGSVEAMTLAEGAYTSFQILHRHASGHLGRIQMLGLLGSLKLGGWTWLDLEAHGKRFCLGTMPLHILHGVEKPIH